MMYVKYFSVVAAVVLLCSGCQQPQGLEIRSSSASEKDLMRAGRALVKAIEEGDVETVKKLAYLHWVPVLPEANKIPMGDKCFFPIHAAAGAGDVEVLKALIAEDADVNARDNSGNTPIMWAVTRSVNVKHKTHKDQDAGRIECIRELVKAGADINAQTILGWTALHWAYFVNPNMAPFSRELVKLGADLNRQNRAGETPLHVWCRNGAISHVQDLKAGISFMIEKGANLCLKNQDGQYADEVLEEKFKLMMEEGKEMVEMLRTARLKQEKERQKR